MLISDSHSFIFVHIYKTGGKSVRAALRSYRDCPTLFRRVLEKLGLIKLPTHASAQDVRASHPDRWAQYFTFAYVRNPWSWQVSLYHFMKQQEEHKQHEEVAAIASFREYLDWRLDGRKHLQQEYICDANGTLMVDFVGRVECMSDDFQEICARIGVEASLPHKNKSSHRDYRDYYDDEMREQVAEHFAEDIERFGYDFDGIARERIRRAPSTDPATHAP